MPDLPTILYFLAVVGGTAVLGGAIAYGYIQYRHRTQREKRLTEEATHRLYEKEEREA